MGALADKANQQSKFLMIEKGGFEIVQYLDFRFVPSQRDPSIEVVQYKFMQGDREKYWTNGNSAVMRYMDTVPPRSFVKVSRNRWLNKDGREDTTKSAYSVMECTKDGDPVREEDKQREQQKTNDILNGDSKEVWDE